MPHHQQHDIAYYCSLINKLLEEVDCTEYRIEQKMRLRIRNDIVNTHKRETTFLKEMYGYRNLPRWLTGSSLDLVREDTEAQNDPYASALPAGGERAFSSSTSHVELGSSSEDLEEYEQLRQQSLSPAKKPVSVVDDLMAQWTTIGQNHEGHGYGMTIRPHTIQKPSRRPFRAAPHLHLAYGLLQNLWLPLGKCK